MNLEAEISLKKALGIILVVLFIIFSGGYIVGKFFFWDQYSKETLGDVQIKRAAEIVQANSKDYNSHLVLGSEYFWKEDYKEALKEYKIADKLAPAKYLPTKLNLGLVYVQLKEYDLALKYLNMVTAKNPLAFEAWVNTGYAYDGKKQYQKALNAFDQALGADPGAADVKVSKALVYEKMGNKKEALKSINDALRFVPDEKEWLDIKKRLTK